MIDGKFGEVPLLNPYYMSIDPGVTNGITFWGEDGKPLHYNEVSIEQLNLVLDHLEVVNIDAEETLNLRKIIVEEWVLYQKKALALSGSRLEAVQVIGMVKRSNREMGLPEVAEVRADAKEIAAKWSGMPMPKRGTHMENWKASFLVGYYWLHTQGIIPARVLEQA